jgi:hypothetical protein
MNTPPKLVRVRDPQALLEKLADHIREVGNVISSDLETGSHHSNNVAADIWHRNHPKLNKWLQELRDMLPEEAEDPTR